MKERRVTPYRSDRIGPALLGLALATTSAHAQTGQPPSVVAHVAGEPITDAQIETLAKDRLARVRAEEYTIKRQVLEDYIQKTLLEREAKARGISVPELLKQEIDAKILPVTDVQLRAVFETSPQYRDKPEDEAFPLIEKNLKALRMNEARRRFLAGLRDKGAVVILMEPPRATVTTDGNPARGPKGAVVTLVEFSDFQCPYCKQGSGVVKQVLAKYGDRIRFVYRDFPLDIHPDANKAAEAGACAADQGKFWEMHDKLFENSKALKTEDLKRSAAALGLETGRFDQCLDSGKFKADIEADHSEGARLGVTGTPTFFVNGRMTVGANYPKLAELIDDELASSAARAQKPAPGPLR
jgi:protein-disulfide isomerase